MMHLSREGERTHSVSQGAYLQVQHLESIRAPINCADLLRMLRTDGRLDWA